MKYSTLLLATLLTALTACGGRTVSDDKPTIVKVPVTVPCVEGERPKAPESLKSQHPNWFQYTPKQKAEYAAAQALKHQSYGQELHAATGACQ